MGGQPAGDRRPKYTMKIEYTMVDFHGSVLNERLDLECGVMTFPAGLMVDR
jgi:hypothetical protein